MIEALDLLSEVRKIDPSSRVLFTTYKYTQSFFEKYIFSHFRGKSLPLVLVDYHEYQNSLRESGKSAHAGTRYLIDSVLVSNRRFHPKIIFSCTEKELKILVSSANLTYAGFSKNAEICAVETIPFTKRFQYPILFDTCDFIFNLKKHIDSEPHKKSLEGILEKVDIELDSSNTNNSKERLLHNLKNPILDQVRNLIPEEVNKVTVISPFFSQNITIFDKLENSFTENIEFILQPENCNFPVKKLESWNNLPNVIFRSINFPNNRYLHGKIILFQTNDNVFILTGSANFTESALLKSAENGGNIEVSLFKQAQPRYFEYLLSSNTHSIKEIKITDVKPIKENSEIPSVNDFRILDAKVNGNQLVISFDCKTPRNVSNFKVHVDNFEKEIPIEPNRNMISIPLSQDDLQALTNSSIVWISYENSGNELISDLRLIHNPVYFSEEFAALNTIVDEDEKTWLFKILSKYASLPTLDYILPIIDRLEKYGFFEADKIRKEELLWELQSRLLNIKPYSASEQLSKLIDRFKQKHEKMLDTALESSNVNDFKVIINSFIMINKLILWLVAKGHQNVHYLRHVRKNVEKLHMSKWINLKNAEARIMCQQSKLLAHLIMVSHCVDYLQLDLSNWSKTYSGLSRNYVKEAFETTFLEAIQALYEGNENQLKKDLKEQESEFYHIMPKNDLSTSHVLFRLNEIIRNLNNFTGSSYAIFRQE